MEPGPHDMISCPYNMAHQVEHYRMHIHLQKCRKQHPNSGKVNCPFDATHVVNELELDYHVSTCPKRHMLDTQLYVMDDDHRPVVPVVHQNVVDPVLDDWESATNKQLRRLYLNLKQRQRAMMKQRQQRMADESINNGMDPDAKEAPTLIVGIDSGIDSDTILEMTEHKYMLPKIERSLNPLEVGEMTDHDYQATETVVPMSLCHTCLGELPNDQQHKRDSSEREYKDAEFRANEKHKMEMKILHEQYREARAKAELAELMLRQKRVEPHHTTYKPDFSQKGAHVIQKIKGATPSERRKARMEGIKNYRPE